MSLSRLATLCLFLLVATVQSTRSSPSFSAASIGRGNHLRQQVEKGRHRALKKGMGDKDKKGGKHKDKKSKKDKKPKKTSGECEITADNSSFSVPRAARFFAPDTTPGYMGSPSIIGTVFFWDKQPVLVEVDGITPINGTFISGTCTRTSTSISGMGSCQLVLQGGGGDISIMGILEGPSGNKLSVVGGTEHFVDASGEMDFLPHFETLEVGDVFLDASSYEVNANIHCSTQ